MVIPTTYAVAFSMMFLTMICWGTWANMQKIAKWRFELFYWDYSFGVLGLMLVFAFTLGSLGSSGAPFLDNLAHADAKSWLLALASGIIFNVANFLLVAAIAIAGMSVAFPVGIGIALVTGTALSYALTPSGHLGEISAGVLLVLVAIILAAIAYRKIPGQQPKDTRKGLIISIVCGLLMGTFYPLLAVSMKPAGSSAAFGPYTALVVFAIGLVICTVVLLPIAMRKPITGEKPVSMAEYRKGSGLYHLAGIAGGIIWAIGTAFNVVASTNAGPAIAYAFGQGATLIAALMGVFIWKEFRGAKGVGGLLTFMFICYLAGLALVGIAPAL